MRECCQACRQLKSVASPLGNCSGSSRSEFLIGRLERKKMQTKQGKCRDGVISKLANPFRNFEISLFFLISISFQGAGRLLSHPGVNLIETLIVDHIRFGITPCRKILTL